MVTVGEPGEHRRTPNADLSPSSIERYLARLVRCADGTWWYAEAGMSDALCEPIPLEPGRSPQGPFHYRLEAITGPRGPGWRFHHDPSGSFGSMDFHLAPARAEMVEAAHRWLSAAPESPFTRLFSIGRRDLCGADILRGRVLIRRNASGPTDRYLDDVEEWFELLTGKFGLPVADLPAAEREALWRRVCAAHSFWEASQPRTVPLSASRPTTHSR